MCYSNQSFSWSSWSYSNNSLIQLREEAFEIGENKRRNLIWKWCAFAFHQDYTYWSRARQTIVPGCRTKFKKSILEHHQEPIHKNPEKNNTNNNMLTITKTKTSSQFPSRAVGSARSSSPSCRRQAPREATTAISKRLLLLLWKSQQDQINPSPSSLVH